MNLIKIIRKPKLLLSLIEAINDMNHLNRLILLKVYKLEVTGCFTCGDSYKLNLNLIN